MGCGLPERIECCAFKNSSTSIPIGRVKRAFTQKLSTVGECVGFIAWKVPCSPQKARVFGRVETIEAIEEVRIRLRVQPRKTIQDAGYDANQVYQDSLRFGWSCWFGDSRSNWDHILPDGSRIKLPYSPIQRTALPGGAVPYLRFAQDYAKDILSRLIQGKGQRWETACDTPPSYFDHCKAEHKREVKPGFWKWEKIHAKKDNHGWDTSVMQVVFATITRRLGIHKASIKDDE